MAVQTIPMTKVPTPKPPIMIPETRPGLEGNQSHPLCMGTMYVSPFVMPKPTEKRNKKAQKLPIAKRQADRFITRPIEAPKAIRLKKHIRNKNEHLQLRIQLDCKPSTEWHDKDVSHENQWQKKRCLSAANTEVRAKVWGYGATDILIAQKLNRLHSLVNNQQQICTYTHVQKSANECRIGFYCLLKRSGTIFKIRQGHDSLGLSFFWRFIVDLCGHTVVLVLQFLK